jgi:hypothetical protein
LRRRPVDPGRRKFEHRDVAFIANSDRIVTPAGIETGNPAGLGRHVDGTMPGAKLPNLLRGSPRRVWLQTIVSSDRVARRVVPDALKSDCMSNCIEIAGHGIPSSEAPSWRRGVCVV